MTNREWLNSLPNEEFLHAILYKVPAIGKLYNDSVLGLIQWMDEERYELYYLRESNLSQFINKPDNNPNNWWESDNQ